MNETEQKKRIFVPADLYAKLAEHAKQKGISVDQEAEQLIELATKQLDSLVAAKRVMEGGDTEL
jgi:hypothetical protein